MKNIQARLDFSNVIILVVLLASTSADERVDSQIMGSKLRYLVNEEGGRNELQNLKWVEMERKHTFPASLSNEKEETLDDSLFLPGSGYTKRFYMKCMENQNGQSLKFVALLMFASEGDNTGDAIQLVSYLQSWLKLLPAHGDELQAPKLQFPVSWQTLFGNAPPKIIF